MQRFSTQTHAGRAQTSAAAIIFATALGLGACDLGPSPDMAALHAATDGYAPEGKNTYRLELATAAIAVHPPANGQGRALGRALPAAPAGEIARRRTDPPERVRIAVGTNVAHCCDDEFVHQFADSQGAVPERIPSSDRQAVEMVLTARADFALIGGKLSTGERQLGLTQRQLGLELFALVVPANSDVRTLDRSQVRRIFTGRVTDWRQLGFAAGPIVPVVPADAVTASRAARVLTPGDRFAKSCRRAPTRRNVADTLLQNPGAVGIVRIRAGTREQLDERVLQIEWADATPAAFANGSYPFGVPLQLITSGYPAGKALALRGFTRSERGRALLGKQLTFGR
ncbi:MAG: substrate-binding domain-containing protein [Planctomycetota bacterium]